MIAYNKLPSHLLHTLIQVFNSRSIFILGAGVSYAYIKPEYHLYENAKSFISNSLTSVSVEFPRKLTENEKERFKIVVGNHTIHNLENGELLIDDTYEDLRSLFIRQNPEIIEILGALTYSTELKENFYPEYEILHFIKNNSLILNFNHDHLAETILKEKKILSMHGTITPQIRTAIQETIPLILNDQLSSSSVSGLFLKEFCLATKENEHELLKNKKYRNFQEKLTQNQYSFLVIIGYSFFKKNSYSIYDVVTYDLIRSYLYESKKTSVIIIDPEPEFPADILANNLKHLKIEMYPIYWNCFTRSLFKMFKTKLNAKKISLDDLKTLNKNYFKLLYANH